MLSTIAAALPRTWWDELTAQDALDLGLNVRRQWQILRVGWPYHLNVGFFVRPVEGSH